MFLIYVGVRENTHAEVWFQKSCFCNFFEIPIRHGCSPAMKLSFHEFIDHLKEKQYTFHSLITEPTLREKCLYSEFFWSVFFRILTDTNARYLSIFSPNMGKYGPEKLRIRTFFTQCCPNRFYFDRHHLFPNFCCKLMKVWFLSYFLFVKIKFWAFGFPY